MTNGERIEAKLDHLIEVSDWLVVAVKHLLGAEAGIEPDEDDWLDEEAPVGDMTQFEHTAVRTRPQPKKPQCPHNQQVLVDGRLACAKCGFIFGSTGLVHNSVGPSGQIQNDPNPPAWALDRSPGASSKNPGGPLVPY